MSITNRLHQHAAKMVALEGDLQHALKQLSELAAGHPGTVGMLNDFAATSNTHLKTLKSRLETIAEVKEIAASDLAPMAITTESHPASFALQHASSILNSAIVGYAMLRSIALRYQDSSLIGDGNTGDIAEQHTKNYVRAVHRINQSLHNVVLWEMDRDSEACQCTCPSCGLGICICAQGPRRTFSDIWLEPGPISTENEVFVHPPRPGSAAEKAGLCHGDVVLAADGQELESHFTLQGIVSAHESGDEVVLQLRRNSGAIEEVPVKLP
jgi:hypothetical protein